MFVYHICLLFFSCLLLGFVADVHGVLGFLAEQQLGATSAVAPASRNAAAAAAAAAAGRRCGGGTGFDKRTEGLRVSVEDLDHLSQFVPNV